MDGIPFVKVSVEEAKAALQKDVIRTEVRLPPQRDWRPVRGRQEAEPDPLLPETFRWLARIPPSVRPKLLPASYPRIANQIAMLWKRPLQCERYLDELMLDHRGDRDGFPPGVAAELAALKVHFFSTTKVMHFGVWGNRIGVD